MRFSPYIVICFTMLSTHLVAQQRPPVLVTLSTPNPIVQSGAPVRLDISVRNLTDHTIKILKALGPGGQADAANIVDVRDASGHEVESLHRHPTWLSRVKVPIEPGQTAKDYVLLNNLVDLTTPGRYVVTVRHQMVESDQQGDKVRRTQIESDSITVTVSP